jgi:hypothetical protein
MKLGVGQLSGNLLKQSLIRSTLMLLLICHLLIAITLFFSRQHWPPPQLENLHLNNCQLPCWIGIVPGETTISEAQTLLKKTYHPSDYDYAASYNPNQGTDWLRITRRSDSIYLIVNFNEWAAPVQQTEDSIISQIKVMSGPAGHLTLGDWGTWLGKPQALSVTWGNYNSQPNALYYAEGVRLTLNNPFNFVVDGWNVPAGTIDIYSDLSSEYPLSYAVRWQGWDVAYKDQLLALMLP